MRMEPREKSVNPKKYLDLHDLKEDKLAWWKKESSYNTVLMGISFKGLAKTLYPIFGL